MNILPIIPQFFPEENGKNLVAVSDFDWTLSVWKNIPDSSAVKADMVYTFDPVASPVDVQYYGKKLVVATRNSLYIWNSTPTSGQKWNSAVVGTIGTVNMQGIDAIATGGSDWCDRKRLAGDADVPCIRRKLSVGR